MQNGHITIAPNEARTGMVLRLAIGGTEPITAELAAPKFGEIIEKWPGCVLRSPTALCLILGQQLFWSSLR